MRTHGLMARLLRGPLTLALMVCAGSVGVLAQDNGPLSTPPGGKTASSVVPILKDVRIDQKLNGQVPLDLTFTDSTNQTVTLQQYFGTKPVVLALVYYECPMLCTQVLNGIVGSLETLNLDAGRDFNVVVVSFDPGETPAQAQAKRATFIRRYRRPGDDDGIHFLTGRQEPITKLTDAVGFRYKYDPTLGQFAHPAAITILTPSGLISKYLYGIDFAPRDLRLALVEASNGKIGTAVDAALLYCYHYDASSGKYSVAVMNIIRLFGVVTVAGFGTFILLSLRRERRQANAVKRTATGTR
jgi:protein SCO1